MLAGLSVFLSLASVQSPAPAYTLDVRDAPTPAVFAMMLGDAGANSITVMRHFPPFVTLRLIEAQIALPPPNMPGRSDYGDYWPIGGWLMRIQRAMKVDQMLVGYEREGNAFYVSRANLPNTTGASFYQGPSINPNEAWHRVRTTGNDDPVAPPADALPSGFRLAGIRWTSSEATRRAVLVVRARDGEAYTRVVEVGHLLGVGDFRVMRIEAGEIVLSAPSGSVRLPLRGVREAAL